MFCSVAFLNSKASRTKNEMEEMEEIFLLSDGIVV
jgi:hypothetical protein